MVVAPDSENTRGIAENQHDLTQKRCWNYELIFVAQIGLKFDDLG